MTHGFGSNIGRMDIPILVAALAVAAVLVAGFLYWLDRNLHKKGDGV
jgi:hypothetical protein